jgi:DNA-binding response OmpR family regulator
MSKRLALVIEDDGNLAEIYSEALMAAGFETEVILGGLTALTRLGAVLPAVVVLDLHLPSVSGVNILRQIRADKRLTNTRVILTTGDVNMAETLRTEADLVLIKPVSFKQLRELAGRLFASDEKGV